MPPSQLKRLKASLREQGIVGPQQSKKQKKQNAQNGTNKDKRVSRTAALSGIREQFNPFEIKTSARGPKFEVTNSRTVGGAQGSKSVKARPGVSKGLSEETRRQTLLVEMQRRNKVGGIMDRRFGENDPTMAPEDKMLERFTQEVQRRHKGASAFDLEDDDFETGTLTHMGQSLSLNGPVVDDFEETDIVLSDAEDHASDDERRMRKRRRSSASGESNDGNVLGEDAPERKKSKQEVMKEVIAKSKFYKYERQQAKDDDADLREELDKELQDIQGLLRSVKRPQAAIPVEAPAGMNPERAALLAGDDKVKFDKEYDLRLRQLALDKKSKPTERSKTEDEKLVEDARRLEDLERRRMKRMAGEADEDEGQPADIADPEHEGAGDAEEDVDEFGLGGGIKPKASRPPQADLGVEDEDDFIIDDDLVASEGEDTGVSDDESNDGLEEQSDDGDDFLDGLLTADEAQRPEFLTGANAPLVDTGLPTTNGVNGDLAYTFPCPQTHSELVEITQNIDIRDLPTVVRRIRALYHPQLKAENKAKLAAFVVALVDHMHHIANTPDTPAFDVLEQVTRHVHSMAKTYPVEVGNAFRRHLQDLHQSRALSPNAGDLVILSAIGSIFPTSDHFHQVVTPAMLTIGRYLGQKIPVKLSDYATGTYLATLALSYQDYSKRYVPEVLGYLLNTLCALAPVKLSDISGSFPYHEPKSNFRLNGSRELAVRAPTVADTIDRVLSDQDTTALEAILMETSIRLLDVASDTWTAKPSFFELFESVSGVLKHLETRPCQGKLPQSTQALVKKIAAKIGVMLGQARMARRPLELHHHKPLAIKTSIPKFEESFNPDKHYDPDRERAEASKLKAEHKKERKGAMRELRKDANFIAREALREKKERDAAYEKKYRRLVAEIQGEEGRESKAYEREKEWRKKGKK